MPWLLLALLVLIILITFFYLRGDDLSAFDDPRPEAIGGAAPSDAHLTVVESLRTLFEEGAGAGAPRGEQLEKMRAYLDDMGRDVVFEGTISPVAEAGLKGEWVIAPDADPARRMLYIHGGAWVMGSPLSHRAITTHFARLIGGAVFALDYRLMPENNRRAGILDCRSAWRWIIDNGPSGACPAKRLFVAGDSAGGNLTLSLLSWIRDNGLRPPDAAVALSPATDGTFSSPSLRLNEESDHMLGPQFGKLNRLPKPFLHWTAWATNRIPPGNPEVSPVFDNLGGLPPTLIHASAAEMLLDDAVRYANKARAAGSPVKLQTWQHMVHVWHMFVSDLPEAQDAFREIDAFLKEHGGEDDRADAA